VSGGVIDRIEAEIAAVEADLAAMRLRLVKLRSAREVLAEYHGPHGVVSSRTKRAPSIREKSLAGTRRVTLQEHIESALSEGPAKRAELLGRVLGTGAETTEAAITTTLSRLRARGDVTNVDGNWKISPQRSVQLAAAQARKR
jgi:hypothetical protein